MSSRRSTTCCRSPICSCRCSRWAVCCSVWLANTTPAPASSWAASKTSPNGYWTASVTSASASRPSTPLPLQAARSASLIPLDRLAGGGFQPTFRPQNICPKRHEKATEHYPLASALELRNLPPPRRSPRWGDYSSTLCSTDADCKHIKKTVCCYGYCNPCQFV